MSLIVFLLICSDLFPLGWQQGDWHAGLRGAPTSMVVDEAGLHLRTIETGQDPYPFNEDLVRSFPRPLARAFVQFQVTLPPFEDWPSTPNSGGTTLYLNLRVTAHSPGDGGSLFWPGIFIGLGSGTPEWGYRVGLGYTLVAHLWEFGPWTFGIATGENGQLRFYARKGHVQLDETDFAAENNGVADGGYFWTAAEFHGLFLALRDPVDSFGVLSTDWVIRSIKVFSQPPTLSITRSGSGVLIAGSGMYPQTAYSLEGSFDLNSWDTIRTLQDGEYYYDQPTQPQRFYRLNLSHE